MMTHIRQTRALLLPALLLLALLAFATTRSDAVSDVVDTGAVSSLVSVAMGLAVAAFVISRVSARR
jgi:predicted nicotinamide N-methyase